MFGLTPFEIITAVLGCLGFLLGIFNVVWLIKHHSPGFVVRQQIGRYFTGNWWEQGIITNNERQSTFIELLVDVRNTSIRDNAIVGFNCTGSHQLLDLPEEPIQIGTKFVTALGPGMKVESSVYWDRPEQLWKEMIPRFIPAGDNVLLPVCYRVQGKPVSDGRRIRIRITVEDTYGKTYSRAILLTQLSTDKNVTPVSAS